MPDRNGLGVTVGGTKTAVVVLPGKKDERTSLVCFQSASACFFLQDAVFIDGEERSD
jgi:hypothetical protein